MHLTQKEQERLLIFTAAEMARRRKAKGIKLNYPDMVRNSFCPEIRVDPETYKVFVNGERATCRPARVLPLAQRYFLR